MSLTDELKKDFSLPAAGKFAPYYFMNLGYELEPEAPMARKRANGAFSVIAGPRAYIYPHDLIVGAFRPLWVEADDEVLTKAEANVKAMGGRSFWTNFDHFAPDYRKLIRLGIPGMLKEIEEAKERYVGDPLKWETLENMRIAFRGLYARVRQYAQKTEMLLGAEGYDPARLNFIRKNCEALLQHEPRTFAEGLQLVWLTHQAFVYEGRYAMALGRMDQYLYPLFAHDLEEKRLTEDEATELLENVFMKIYERHAMVGWDDVVNICIGGQNERGECEVNRLSYCILHAVEHCNVPGPNLSARITQNTPDEFLDDCLRVIGTGLGYPALMNDEINLKALSHFGYEDKDRYDYCMVGCIENFITGRQPPWSDGRFDTPRFLEYTLNRGKGILHDGTGFDDGEPDAIASMDELMKKIERQLEKGVKDYVENFLKASKIEHPENFTQPFLSCFADACIERGADICLGGAKYPSVHGAALMGVGTMADSLAAIEKTVFVDHSLKLSEIAEAMRTDFEGREEMRRLLLAAPKYGNNDDFVDRYAVWFVDFLTREFGKYRTYDGGYFYSAMAANTSNIYAGHAIAATPDGRKAREPLSDAASPTYGRDKRGATAVINSLTKPDYSCVACGSVVNQKFSPAMFTDENRPRLVKLLRTYFNKGGQEMQINATSREVLQDAMEHPENYPDMVVRVSGFSAIYITLGREVQTDILNRTQQA